MAGLSENKKSTSRAGVGALLNLSKKKTFNKQIQTAWRTVGMESNIVPSSSFSPT